MIIQVPDYLIVDNFEEVICTLIIEGCLSNYKKHGIWYFMIPKESSYLQTSFIETLIWFHVKKAVIITGDKMTKIRALSD